MYGRLVQQGPGDGESEECSEHSIIQDIFPPKVIVTREPQHRYLLVACLDCGTLVWFLSKYHDYLSVQMWEEEGVLWRQSVVTRVPVRGDVVSGDRSI